MRALYASLPAASGSCTLAGRKVRLRPLTLLEVMTLCEKYPLFKRALLHGEKDVAFEPAAPMEFLRTSAGGTRPRWFWWGHRNATAEELSGGISASIALTMPAKDVDEFYRPNLPPKDGDAPKLEVDGYGGSLRADPIARLVAMAGDLEWCPNLPAPPFELSPGQIYWRWRALQDRHTDTTVRNAVAASVGACDDKKARDEFFNKATL